MKPPKQLIKLCYFGNQSSPKESTVINFEFANPPYKAIL